jgi:sensor c-di-GMP phosphodiesterase-like protein
VGLAATLGMVTIAEGVETDEQPRHVKRRGVSLAQGWLFGMSLPISEFEQHWSAAPSEESRRLDRRAHAAGGH